MAFEVVNPTAGIWLARGLRYLLMPEDLAEARQPAPASRGPVAKSQCRRPSKPVPERMEAQAVSASKRSPDWKPLPETDWPPEWRKQLEQTKRGKVAWTYADIGKDLLAGRNPDPSESAEAAQARARRSQLLRKLLGALKHPAGTHTFWPCQLGDALQPDLFWSGVRALGSRGVIILGEECALSLLGATARPFTARIFRGQKAVVLRALEEYHDADHDSIISFLRSSLAQIVR